MQGNRAHKVLFEPEQGNTAKMQQLEQLNSEHSFYFSLFLFSSRICDFFSFILQILWDEFFIVSLLYISTVIVGSGNVILISQSKYQQHLSSISLVQIYMYEKNWDNLSALVVSRKHSPSFHILLLPAISLTASFELSVGLSVSLRDHPNFTQLP